jgi:fermentation-respiration switch protein FrsA (DUF1100 family)
MSAVSITKGTTEGVVLEDQQLWLTPLGSILLAGLLFNATNQLASNISAYDYNSTSSIGMRSPAIIVMHPAGGVKEQTASIWAEKLSENGFVTLAYDASYQGGSGGLPHFLEDPAERISDVSSVVDYLYRQDYVDPERIAVLGICGGGGYAAAATLRDHRIKALATVSMVNNGVSTRLGWYGTDNPSINLEAHIDAAPQLAAGADLEYIQYFPDPVTNSTPYDLQQANEYYSTPRGFYPTARNIMVARSLPFLNGFDAFTSAEIHLTQPTILIAGENAGSRWHTERLDQMIGGATRKLIIPAAAHMDLYDNLQVIDTAVREVAEFMRIHLV